MPPSAISGHAGLVGAFERRLDRRDLRHAHAGDDARRADRAGADADLDAVGAVVDQRLRAGRGGDVAADHLDLREALLDPRDAVEHALRMAVRGVDDDHVGARLDERLDALLGVGADADRGADAQPAELVLARVRVLGRLEDVLDGDEAAQLHVAVDDQHALEAVPVHQRLGRVEVGALGHRHEPLARRHDVGDRLVEIRLEAQVAVGDDADDALASTTGRPEIRCCDVSASTSRTVIDGGIVIGSLTTPLSKRLTFATSAACLRRRHVLVDDAEAAFLRDRDREARLGDRVHRRRQQRDVERDRPREAGVEGDFAGYDGGVRGDQQDVVERQRFADDSHRNFSLRKNGLYPCRFLPSPRIQQLGARPRGSLRWNSRSIAADRRGGSAMPGESSIGADRRLRQLRDRCTRRNVAARGVPSGFASRAKRSDPRSCLQRTIATATTTMLANTSTRPTMTPSPSHATAARRSSS